MGATLQHGKPVAETGMLGECHGHIVIAPVCLRAAAAWMLEHLDGVGGEPLERVRTRILKSLVDDGLGGDVAGSLQLAAALDRYAAEPGRSLERSCWAALSTKACSKRSISVSRVRRLLSEM